jgi:hypothetical protein
LGFPRGRRGMEGLEVSNRGVSIKLMLAGAVHGYTTSFTRQSTSFPLCFALPLLNMQAPLGPGKVSGSTISILLVLGPSRATIVPKLVLQPLAWRTSTKRL